MVERFGKEPFEAPPGTKFQYINLGYYLLSEIIERVTGVPYPEYVERELLRPLGLAHTLYADDHRVILNRAAGYEYYGGLLHNAPYVSPIAIGVGAGGLCSTVGDLVRWTHLPYGGKVVSAASLRLMAAPAVLARGDTVPYGFGLYQGRLGAHRKVYRGGTRPGFGAYLARYPSDSLTIVVLTNAGGGREKAEEIEKSLAQTAFGLAKPAAPPVVALSAPEFVRYEGTYTLQAGARTLDLRVFSDGGQLMGQASGQAAWRLRYQGNHEFLVGEGNDIRLGFAVAQGRAESVTLYQGAARFRASGRPRSASGAQTHCRNRFITL
jgi:D-alanyl-D-alanine carboxypeptidase